MQYVNLGKSGLKVLQLCPRMMIYGTPNWRSWALEHLEQAIAALDIVLSEDEVSSLEEAYQPHPVLGHT